MVQIIFASDGGVDNLSSMNQIQQEENPANITLVDMNLVQNMAYGLNVGLAVVDLGKQKDAAMIITGVSLKKIIFFFVSIEVKLIQKLDILIPHVE